MRRAHSQEVSAARVVLVLAHPDDELIVGGTASRLSSAGSEVTLVCATNGAGGAGRLQHGPDELADLRYRELQSSCQILGIQDLVMLEQRGGAAPLGQRNYRDVMGQHEEMVLDVLDQVGPELVVTFGPDGITGHPTHVMVGQVARRAARRLSVAPDVLQVAYSLDTVAAIRAWVRSHPDVWAAYEEQVAKTPNVGTMELDLFPLPEVSLDIIVDVSAQRDTRIAAARCHVSQGGDGYLQAFLASDLECFSRPG